MDPGSLAELKVLRHLGLCLLPSMLQIYTVERLFFLNHCKLILCLWYRCNGLQIYEQSVNFITTHSPSHETASGVDIVFNYERMSSVITFKTTIQMYQLKCFTVRNRDTKEF